MANDPVDDAAYAGDVEDDQDLHDDLGVAADPATIPPDEGDAGRPAPPESGEDQ